MVGKKEYSAKFFKKWVGSFFNNSNKNFASFFMDEGDMDLTELEELKKMIEQEIETKKTSRK